MKNLMIILFTLAPAVVHADEVAAIYSSPDTVATILARLDSSPIGREIMHGKPDIANRQIVDTNALTKTIIKTYSYPDGYLYAETNITPFRIKRPTSTAIADAAALPERLKRLREEREANARTNWVYSITGNRQRTPRRFSVMRITLALKQAGYWPQVEAYMDETGLLPVYYTANDFREDDPLFIQGVTILQTRLGLTSEQIERILNSCLYQN